MLGAREADIGLFSFVGDLIGGSSKKKAISKAEQAQLDAQQKAYALQQQALEQTQGQYQQTQDQLRPWIGAGTAANNSIADILGLSGGPMQEQALAALQDSPLFRSLVGNGEDAIRANASATGGLRGGNTQDALSRFRGDAFVQTIQNQLANLGGLSSTGLSAVNSGGNFGAAASAAGAGIMTNQGNLDVQGGATRAGGILGRNAVTQQMIQSGVGLASQVAGAFIPGAGGLSGLTGSGGGGGIASKFASLF